MVYQKGYPEAVIEKEMEKVQFSKQGQNSKKVENGVRFLATYYILLNKLTSIRYRNIYLLHMNQKVKNVIIPRSTVSFRSTRKISTYLTKAKLYPLERKSGYTNVANEGVKFS